MQPIDIQHEKNGVQMLHVSQQSACCFQLAALSHVPHGDLGALGPGLSSVSPDSATTSMLKYLLDDFIHFGLCISIIDLMFVK
jgi:hypothetical protein